MFSLVSGRSEEHRVCCPSALSLCSPMGCGGVQPPPAAMGSFVSSDSRTLCQDLSSGFPAWSPRSICSVPWSPGALLALPQSNLQKMRARNLLQSWLFIATKQSFSFLFVPCSQSHADKERWDVEPCAVPSTNGDFGYFSCQATFHPHRLLFAAGTCEGRGCVTKAKLLGTYRTNICHSSRNRTAN